MIKKLYKSLIFLVAFVALILFSNQIVIRQFVKSSNTLLVEYHELYALQNYKTAMLKLYNAVTTSVEANNYRTEIHNAKLYAEKQLSLCNTYVTKKHINENWHHAELHFNNTINLINQSLPSKELLVLHQPALANEINNLVDILNSMIIETSDEIKEAEKRNITIKKHGTRTLFSVGILFILVLAIGGYQLTRKINHPIKLLLNATRRIRSGDKEIRVSIDSPDEFADLAASFNLMLDNLKDTTISLAYVNTIIDNIYGALFVTNLKGEIQSCNKVALTLLDYSREELINQHILSLFNQDKSSLKASISYNIDINKLAELTKSQTEIIDKHGTAIPVMIASTILTEHEHEGLIIVAHDITEKLAIEEALAKIQRESLIAINAAQETERMRIATDLHDSLGQKLSAISFMLQSISGSNCNYPDKLNEVQKLTDAAISETRNISHSLISGVLKDFGLVAALKDLFSTTNTIQETKFVFSCYNLEGKAEQNLELALFRICQEAVNNILKHAKAQNATFQLFKSENTITLMIEDDGVGFDTKDFESGMKTSGIGLINIRERVAAFNGNLIINSRQNKGTELIIELPLHAK